MRGRSLENKYSFFVLLSYEIEFEILGIMGRVLRVKGNAKFTDVGVRLGTEVVTKGRYILIT